MPTSCYPTLDEVKKKLSERAIHYLNLYTPERPDLFPEMLDSLLGAPDEEQFKNFVVLYITSPEYPRPDIALATGIVSREKGWKR